MGGFDSPHRVLNEYVRLMTGYEPTDAVSAVELEPPVTFKYPQLYNIQCSKLDTRTFTYSSMYSRGLNED
jgi:hypothetical protein